MLRKKIEKNEFIRAREVRLIDQKGENKGIVSLKEALNQAKKSGLDLVKVADTNPPVCKIVDYGKYLYRQQKKNQRKAQGQKSSELKSIRLGFNISKHDLQTRLKTALNFLKQGHKVKVEMPLYGRQKTKRSFAEKKIEQFLEALNQEIEIKREDQIKQRGNNLNLIITRK